MTRYTLKLRHYIFAVALLTGLAFGAVAAVAQWLAAGLSTR